MKIRVTEFATSLNFLALVASVILQDQRTLPRNQFLQTVIQAVKHFLGCLIRWGISAGRNSCRIEIRTVRALRLDQTKVL